MTPADRVVGVTGAGTGIGAAAAEQLAAGGAQVVLADIDEAQVRQVAERIQASGGRAEACALDVRDAEAIAEFFAGVGARYGRLDGLLCSAGVFPRIGLDAMTPADVDAVLSVNFRGSVLTVLAAVPLFREGGSIVLMTSGGGALSVARTRFQRGFSLYGASKAALDRWAFGVADELLERQITINLLCPGAVVRTPGVARLDFGERAMRSSVSPEEVAPAIVELIGEFGRGATGRWLRATDYGRTWGPGGGAD
jgi:3-oxoacyl-[acyl-carrier protein] reductase